MKVRESLVSNSSSTSFIIAFKDSKPCPHCGRTDPNIVKMVENAERWSGKNEVVARGLNDVNAYFNCNFYPEDDKNNKIRDNIQKYGGKEDWELAVIKISYGNEELRTILDNGISSGNIIKLHEEDE